MNSRRVFLLTSYISNGPVKDTHTDGSFHFFGSLQQQVRGVVNSVAMANSTSDIELHVVHDDASLSKTKPNSDVSRL